MRSLTNSEINGLCLKTGELLHEVGLDMFARSFSRVKGPELSKYSSPSDPRTIPIDILTTAEMVAGNPIVSRYALALQGFDVVPLRTAPGAETTTEADVLAAVKEVGDVVAAFLTARADGHIDALDRLKIKREINEAIAKLIEIDRGLGL